MLNSRILAVAALAAGLAACQKKPAEPKPPVPVADAATQAGISTSSKLGVMLNAPANYLRTTVGRVDEAKKAAEVYKKSIGEHMQDPAEGTGN